MTSSIIYIFLLLDFISKELQKEKKYIKKEKQSPSQYEHFNKNQWLIHHWGPSKMV